jgi:hypothetical protein
MGKKALIAAITTPIGDNMKKASVLVLYSILVLTIGMGLTFRPDIVATLDIITVDSTVDSNDAAYQACTIENDEDCSLRGAISKSNATTGGIGTIMVPAGIYQLTIVGAGEIANATGDLNFTQPVNIIGAGKNDTFIQAGSSKGNGIDRVFSMYNSTGTVRISDLTIRWGTVSSGYNGGGGIYLPNDYYTSTFVLERVGVIDNTITVSRHGGGIFTTVPTTIYDSTFDGNTTAGEGAGIYHSYASLVVERSTISGNSAGTYGGGIANNSTAVLRNVTINGNSASYNGGGITQWNHANLSIYNTTIANNTNTAVNNEKWFGAEEMFFYAYNSIISAPGSNSACRNAVDGGDHNISKNSTCGTTGFTIADPLLGTTLGDNGGLTLTLALPGGSPAIDAGDNASCMAFDQRGVMRRYDGDGNGSIVCDAGAYEYNTGLTLFNLFAPLIKNP